MIPFLPFLRSVVLYIAHWVTFTQCEAVSSPIADVNIAPPLQRLSLAPRMVHPDTMKAVVAVSVLLLWTYTVHAMRAFADFDIINFAHR